MSERVDRRGDERIDRGPVTEVARQRDMVAAECVAESTQLVGVGARHRKPRALRGERLRDGRTNAARGAGDERSEEHTSELQSLMRISYAVFCLKKKTKSQKQHTKQNTPRRHQESII